MKRFFLTMLLIFLTAADVYAAAPVKKTAKKPTAAEIEKKQNEDDFRKAEALLYQQKPRKALPELIRLCGKDYLRACSLLGFTYYSGRYGIPQNTQSAIEWYAKCAEKEKNFFCHKELGQIHYRAAEYDKAFSYYKAAAFGEDAEAQYRLGKLYLDGKGVHTDYEKALKWMRKAAHAKKNPNQSARCALVKMSYFGIGMRRSIKDTKYWMSLCDTPLVEALMSFFGHGVPKDKDKAKEILTRTGLKETLEDWNDLNGQSAPSVGKKTIRDQIITEDCLKRSPAFGDKNKQPKISTYAIKIFDSDFYRSFDIHDGYIEKAGIGDQTFEACGITFYTTLEHKRLFNKALKNKDVIKISRYKDACLGTEMTEICDLNLSWQDLEKSGEEQ